MIRHSIFRIYLFAALILLSCSLDAQIKGFSKIHWEKERIAPGLTWKSAHTLLNDSIPQNFNFLIINTNKRVISLSYKPGKNIVLSRQAEDAGGSTTRWISGKPFNGVVNMPCDNKKFDHEGERAVSDIIIIK